MVSKINEVLSLRDDLARIWDILVANRHKNIFDEFPRAQQIVMISRMIQCEKDISDMIDVLDNYMKQLAKEKQEELRRESESDWWYQKTFGDL